MSKTFFFVLGTVVGSFIDVVVGRFGKDKKWWQGRSFCDHCQRKLKWWENIPIFSYLFLKGRCLTCHSPIPMEYPLVELSTGLIFLFTIQHVTRNTQLNNFYLYLLTTSYLLLATLLILVFLFDLHYQIIPDWTVIGLIFLSFFLQLLSSNFQLLASILSGFGASIFFLFLHLITRGRGMGLGDVKYAFFMGFFLQWPKILIGLYTSFLTGAIIGVILILMDKKKFGQRLAFGPFLVIGTFTAWIWGEKIIYLWDYLLKL